MGIGYRVDDFEVGGGASTRLPQPYFDRSARCCGNLVFLPLDGQYTVSVLISFWSIAEISF